VSGVEMLEDVAAYLTLAPLAATLVVVVAAVLWLTGRPVVPVRIRARIASSRRPR
jgi:hypothetical protein